MSIFYRVQSDPPVIDPPINSSCYRCEASRHHSRGAQTRFSDEVSIAKSTTEIWYDNCHQQWRVG